MAERIVFTEEELGAQIGDILLDASVLLELDLPDEALAFLIAAVAEAMCPEGYEVSGILIA